MQFLKTRRFAVFLVAAVAVPASLQAQLSLGGPITSVVFHSPSHSVRQLIGVPGAAHYGPPLATADRGFPSPDGTSVILMGAGASSLLAIAGLGDTAPSLVSLLSGAEQAAWARDSRSAFVFDPTSLVLQVLTLSPGGWMASDAINVSQLMGGAKLLAALGSCRCALFTVPDGPIQHLVIAGADGSVRSVADLDVGTALGLDSDDQLFLASDSQVERMHLSDVTPSRELLIQDTALVQPLAVFASPAAKVLLVATRDQKIRIYDPGRRQLMNEISLDFQASSLNQLDAPGSYYELNDPTQPSDPLYVLQLGQTNRVFFVPAVEQ